MGKTYDAVIGAVVGDALGVPVEFMERDTYKVTDMIGYGTHNQPPGTWSDDSSMMLATLSSMFDKGEINANGIMENFKSWRDRSAFTPYGEVFDIGGTTDMAISRYADKRMKPEDCGLKGERDNGNGALMRILPVSIANPGKVVEIASLTHAHAISNVACVIYTYVIQNIKKGMNKNAAYTSALVMAEPIVNAFGCGKTFSNLPAIPEMSRGEIKSSGYVVDSLEAAFWCFMTEGNYKDIVLKAVNLGDDTDTIGCIAGGLAGLYYGTETDNGVPKKWIDMIPKIKWITTLCALCDEIYM